MPTGNHCVRPIYASISAAPSGAIINRYSEKSFSDTASLNAAAIGYTQAAVRDIHGESICASAAR
ncbi:hypothetical protein E2704_00805 [Salmonella enterica]|uniref:Uncharacterized protein n=3 Tax=Salmonella enterica TaxID=28901 RepID=A0A3R0BI68_SALER|nr:hypothetical protein LFZ50_13060 [Salmonella enterica subsp. arizonae serovar 53:-:- str. SA20100345]AXC75359.1 hypothetical protein DOE56_00975 [Salmonella enterica subsp. arizonae serovar 63:g,z51:-]EAA5367589.1 hypothetical protein [Salmonella enterica subsp. arizonae]EAA7631835.1 hypothetical protein [Salmonella enterica]EAN8390186.1 hypothetical protein [Salmonella enterica subsp. arizonae serovar 13,23:gz51:-]EAN8609848.1 hypothetical protein [Salmonella enterica subsp. arizonae serov